MLGTKAQLKNDTLLALKQSGPGEIESLEEFKELIRLTGLAVPAGSIHWREDTSLGYQRLAGVNPVMIELCQSIPKR